ncbi:MAG: EAL domain-containing protein [Actinomycetota bacterium]
MTKILVIEDEEQVRETLVELLTICGDFNVIGADNGRIGVQQALSEIPDLILCDVQMPEMDGYEVLRTLRQSTLAATIPFIFLTAQGAKADFRRGMELGADDYLTKPFTKAELFGAIASRLSKRQTITQPLAQALQQAEEKLNHLVHNSPTTEAVTAERLALEAGLRRALTHNEFLVYYQPQVDVSTGQIIGAEALVRWQNPEKGMISPADFIPLAEETGLIIPIGEWVLLRACTQAARWIAAGFSPFRISVNLSARQLSEPQLKERILQILETTGLEPDRLELEVTESAVLENTAAAGTLLNELKAEGVHVAIDDFGTGYASLGYLKQFPFDTLKIDKSFVRNVNDDPQNTAITTALIILAHSLNLKAVAEGVETESELAFLRQQQCDRIQGYLFSRPIDKAEFENLLKTDKTLPVPPPESLPSRVLPFLPSPDRDKSQNIPLSGCGG